MTESLRGVVTDHELVSITVGPPVLPASVEDHARAVARQKALSFTDDRRHLLTACAVEVERYLRRIIWPPARTSVAVVIVRDHYSPVAYCQLYPDAGGLTAVLTSVQRWEDVTQTWMALTSGADDGYRLAPGARIIVSRSGQYEITATLTAPTAVTPSAVEAVSRLWAYRATLRPGDLSEVAGEQQVLAGGMMKSGAAEILRGDQWRVAM